MANTSDIAPLTSREENKLLKLIQASHPGFHPALVLAEIAGKNETDDVLKVQAAKALLPYVAPALKSIEVSGHIKKDFGVLRVIVKEDTHDEIDITPEKSNIELSNLIDIDNINED
jgi:hypothetical protein